MTFASHTVFLFIIIIVPAIVFRRFFYANSFSKQFYVFNVFQLFSTAIPIGITLNLLALKTHNFFVAERPILFSEIADAIASNYDLKTTIQIEYFDLLKYTLLLYLACVPLGILSRKTIRLLRLDIKVKLFRFSNYWHYFFTGENAFFPETHKFISNENLSRSLINVTRISFISRGADDGFPMLYKGLYSDYTLKKKTNELDSIILTNVYKRKLLESAEQSNKAKRTEDHAKESSSYIEALVNTNDEDYKLAGDYTVFAYSDIRFMEAKHFRINEGGDSHPRAFRILIVAIQIISIIFSCSLIIVSLNMLLSAERISCAQTMFGLMMFFFGTILMERVRGVS